MAFPLGIILMLGGGFCWGILQTSWPFLGKGTFQNIYHLRVAFFSLYQAGLGAFFSVCIALSLLGTLYKIRHTLGGKFLRKILELPFFLPSIVGCLSLVIVFGQNGMIAWLFKITGATYTTFLYGLQGIILCYIFYYVPYVLRLLFEALDALPRSYETLALACGMRYRDRLRWVYYPVIRKEISRSFFLVFMQCLKSFTIVLVFGGLPGNTTLEVAMYQALHFEMDWAAASQLALLQVLISGTLFGVFGSMTVPESQKTTLQPSASAYQPIPEKLNFMDWGLSLIAALFFSLPLAGTLFQGMTSMPSMITSVEMWKSVGVSLMLGVSSASFAFLTVIPLVHLAYHLEKRKKPFFAFCVGDIGGNLSLFFSPILVSALFFMFFAHSLNHDFSIILLLSFLNAFCFLPYLYNVFYVRYQAHRKTYDTLCTSLGIKGASRFSYVDFPALKGTLSYTLSLCFMFSLGDSKIILFFSPTQFHTLTSLLYEKMKGYQFQEAACLGCVLLMLSFFISHAFEKLLGKKIYV
ncbi:MAG: ABC transporter permease subunit [Alphaproteobacteria bacterium]